MLRAAARGVVDFSKARLGDVAWWRRVNTLVQAMARDDELVPLRAAFDYRRSLVGNSGLTPESFKDSQKTAGDLFQEITTVVRPWADKAAAAATETVVGGLIDAYKRLIGDPNDPEFRAKLVKDLEAQKAGRGARTESDEERVERLMQERDAARGRR